MAPTPVNNDNNNNNNLMADPTSTSTTRPSAGYWTKANIIGTCIFAIFALVIATILLTFFIRRRMEQRTMSTNPHPDKAGLLANEDKRTMFSRNQASNVTLYIDSETDVSIKSPTQETVSLIPLQITTVQEAVHPINTTQSQGSGISSASRMSSSTQRTVLLSPISPTGEEGDAIGARMAGRPRSTSASSARYYERTSVDVPAMPVPIIVRPVSD